jgi:hypothetical protein
MLGVIRKVAALAKCLQVAVVAVLWNVVKVGYRQDDARPFTAAVFRRPAASENSPVISRIYLAVSLQSLKRARVLVDAANDHVAICNAALLAAITGTRQDTSANLFPVRRIPAAVLGLYRHTRLNRRVSGLFEKEAVMLTGLNTPRCLRGSGHS